MEQSGEAGINAYRPCSVRRLRYSLCWKTHVGQSFINPPEARSHYMNTAHLSGHEDTLSLGKFALVPSQYFHPLAIYQNPDTVAYVHIA